MNKAKKCDFLWQKTETEMGFRRDWVGGKIFHKLSGEQWTKFTSEVKSDSPQ